MNKMNLPCPFGPVTARPPMVSLCPFKNKFVQLYIQQPIDLETRYDIWIWIWYELDFDVPDKLHPKFKSQSSPRT